MQRRPNKLSSEEKDVRNKIKEMSIDGQYEFVAMPFGLRNAASIYQRAITRSLGGLANSYIIVYMDDVMIGAESK